MFVNDYLLNVDIKRRLANIVPTFAQGETSRLRFKIYDNNILYDLTGFTKAEIIHKLPNGDSYTSDASKNANGEIEYNYPTKIELSEIGKVEVSLVIYSNNTSVSIHPFTIFVYDNFKGENLSYIGVLQDLIEEVQYLEVETNKQLVETNNKINEITTFSNTMTTAENTRKTNETTRQNNETARVNAENTRVSNENTRKTNETDRQSNETARSNAENTRVSNENERKTNETARVNSENTRDSNENTRKTNETSRVNAENTRATNENERKTNETTRQSNETVRDTNENTRKANETARDTVFNAKITEVTNATTDATTQANYAKTQGDYAKQQGDLITDILDNGSVQSVNNQTGIVTITPENIGAISAVEKNIPNGVATLNADGKVVDSEGNIVEGKVNSVNGEIGNVVINVPTKTSELTNDSSYATTTDISNQINLLSNVAKSGSYDDLTNKPTIPNVSSFVQKSGDTMTGLLNLHTYHERFFEIITNSYSMSPLVANVFYCWTGATLAPYTFSFKDNPTSQNMASITLLINQGSTPQPISWHSSIVFKDRIVPDLSKANTLYALTFFNTGGTYWYGSLAGVY